MSATAIAQTAIKFLPQAVSLAKDLASKFAPNMLAAIESSLPVESIALLDNGYSRFNYLAKQAISEDKNFANNLHSLSVHLSESHPALANRISTYAAKALNKAGLSDEEISFLHEHLTKISSSESEVKSETIKGQPTAEDVHILIDLIAKGGLDPSREAAYVETLNHQTAVPLSEVKQRLIEASEKHHPTEPIPEEAPITNSLETEQSSSVSTLDGSLTEAQRNIILEASKRIPITVHNEKLSTIVEKLLPHEGTQASISTLAEDLPSFFQTLSKIATGQTTTLTDYKTTVSGLLGIFNVSLPEKFSLNNLHTKYEISITPAESQPQQQDKATESKTQTQTANTSSSTHLDSLIGNIRDVLVREVKGSSTLFGMAQRAVSAAKNMGIPLPESISKVEDIGKVLDELVLTDNFKSSLESSIKGEKVDFQGSSELQTKAFQIINWGIWSINKLPKIAIEYFPLAVNALKWAMPVARFIPVFGSVLCTTYPILDEVAKVIDKFQVEAENIRTACSAIKNERSNNAQTGSESKTERVQEPELATAST